MFLDNWLSTPLLLAAESGSDSWDDEPTVSMAEDDALATLNEERAAVLRSRTVTGDWCKCEKCYPVRFAKSHNDVTCCQETEGCEELCWEPQLNLNYLGFYYHCLDLRYMQNATHVFQCTNLPSHASYRERQQRLRQTAYQSFTAWAHGRLGEKNRIPIPHCVLKAVREKFPDIGDTYVGFQEPPVDSFTDTAQSIPGGD